MKHSLIMLLSFAITALNGSELAEKSRPAEAAWHDKFAKVFPGQPGDVYQVLRNDGGYGYEFLDAAEALKHGVRKLVVIDGWCASACVLFADRGRKKICITEQAVFAFHKGYAAYRASVGNYKFVDTLVVMFSDPPQSPDIDAWVKTRGGYPAQGVLTMNFSEAQRFWRVCSPEETLPLTQTQTTD